MIQVYLKNLQTIDEYVFKFPDTGLVQLFGDNSNGKSILCKALKAVVMQTLKYDDKRLPLISDDEQEGVFGISANGASLIVVINRVADNCVYQLTRANKERVTRRIREDGIDEMLREFGFLIYDKRSICLQLCETFGARPFVNTSDLANGEIVNSVITDVPSEHFIESYKLTFKEAKLQIDSYKMELTRLQTSMEASKPKNVAGASELAARMKKCFEINANFKHYDEIKIDYVPVLHFDMEPFDEIKPMFMPYIIDCKIDEIPSLDYIMADLDKMERGYCPECGRRYLEDKCLK